MKCAPHLSFNGNCREAMIFYQQCLGGSLHLQTVGDSPKAAELPSAFQEYILHGSLTVGEFLIMATDLTNENQSNPNNQVSIFLWCDTSSELHDKFDKLGSQGIAIQPISSTDEGGLSGELTDQFGVNWILRIVNC